MAELSQEMIAVLENYGAGVLDHLIQTGMAEVFRNYMIHNFGWFKGNFIPHSKQHRVEAAWYKFYIDHGKIPPQIDPASLVNGTCTQVFVEFVLESIADAYKDQYDYDVLEPKEEMRAKKLTLKGFERD